MVSDVEYFSRRAREEREAAMRAAQAHVREIHLNLAEAYERRLQAMSAEARRSGIHLVSAA